MWEWHYYPFMDNKKNACAVRKTSVPETYPLEPYPFQKKEITINVHTFFFTKKRSNNNNKAITI